jgi:protein kinase A
MKFATLAQVVLHTSSSGGGASSSHFRRKSSKMATVTPQMVEEDKQFIARFSEQQEPLPPEEVQQDPRNKELGRSSRGLSVKDFELVRTLGTGAFCFIDCAVRQVGH